MDLTTCPECRGPAEVQWRAVLESTDGPVEHAKVLCVRRHWFLLPVAGLVRADPDDTGSGSVRPRPSETTVANGRWPGSR